jgi:hypothetical protein
MHAKAMLPGVTEAIFFARSDRYVLVVEALLKELSYASIYTSKAPYLGPTNASKAGHPVRLRYKVVDSSRTAAKLQH